MRGIAYALAAFFLLSVGQAQAASLAELLSGSAPAKLTTDTVHGYFAPLIDVQNFSRDRCFPVLKATPQSTLPLAASFLGTTLHRPCTQPQAIVIAKFQFRSATSNNEVYALAGELTALNGHPCYQGTDAGRFAIFWSDSNRVLGLSDGIDQGTGYTLTLFSRHALTPPEDDSHAAAFKLWNGSIPPSCQTR